MERRQGRPAGSGDLTKKVKLDLAVKHWQRGPHCQFMGELTAQVGIPEFPTAKTGTLYAVCVI